MTIAWVFPGQGSQKLGMANSLQDLPGSRAVSYTHLTLPTTPYV